MKDVSKVPWQTYVDSNFEEQCTSFLKEYDNIVKVFTNNDPVLYEFNTNITISEVELTVHKFKN